MLRNELFTFTDIFTDENTVKANVELNPAHPIFAGHFPNEPVLPGVCMLQIVKEALEAWVQKPTRLVIGNNLKFLSMIVPEKDRLMQLTLKINFISGKLHVVAELSADVVLFKFKGVFAEVG